MKIGFVKTHVAAGACLAVGLAVAGSDDWVFDVSRRPAETTSSGSAALASALESRATSFLGSAAAAVDSRCGDSRASSPGALDSTKRGFCIIVR